MPCAGRGPATVQRAGTDRVRNQDVADEKDTDSAPDKGVTESDSAAPETDGIQGEYAELDALDDREDEFDDASGSEDDRADDRDDDGADGGDDDRELVGVGAASKSRSADGSSGTVATSGSTGGGRKGRATPKQRARAEKSSRGGPVSFVRGSVSELQKVVYPTWPQLANYFVVVLVFVLIIIGIVAGLDYGIGWLMLKVFA